MSAPVVESPPMFGRVDQRPASLNAGFDTSRRAANEVVAPVLRVELPGVPVAVPTQEEMVVERLRIAFGVNDTVICHLFSIGLTLQTTRTMVSDLVQVRLDATIDELDDVISELRSLIFDL